MMATNPLLLSIREAVRLNKELDRLFALVGNSAHPRGRILTAYRVALRALQGNTSPSNVREVMRNLRNQVEREAAAMLTDAAVIGYRSAVTQAKYYGFTIKPKLPDTAKIEAQAESIAAQVEAQAAAALGLAALEREEELIIGTEARAGVVRPAPVTSGLTIGLAALMGAAFSVAAQTSTHGFSKQAIAALDSRTTDCCLQVHGQIQPFDGLFHLTGEPRFADDMDWSPFHWNCRTSVAMYKPEYDDGLTDKMRAGADFVLSERREGRNPDQWPVDAFFS
jgi:hypothetical protein